MSIINSPQDALQIIHDLAEAEPKAKDSFARDVFNAAADGLRLCAPSFSMVPMQVENVQDALEYLRTAASETGRHYLPSHWVRQLAQQGLNRFHSALSDKLQHDPVIVHYALAYVDLAASGDAGELLDPTELAEAQGLLEPLRPLPPVPEAIEALLAQACAEQMIDAGEAKDLRELARRLAK